VSLITLKSRRELDLMREAGKLVAQAHQLARGLLQPGITTAEIDAAVEEFYRSVGAQSLFKGFPGKVPYPAVTCISVNEEIVHGIPGPRKLQEGDIVSLDTACKFQGWCADAAWTYPIGTVTPQKQHLLNLGERVLEIAIQALREEKRWSGVAKRMMQAVREAKCSLVEDFVGHGIGRNMHEPPQVPNYFSPEFRKEDFELRPGLVLAIEPMINAGSKYVKILADHWTAVTRDGQPSVHFEHTVAVTADGPEILTAGVGETS
jgi:methionyl aminopeptidase